MDLTDMTLRDISYEYLPAPLQIEYDAEDLRKMQTSGNAIWIVRKNDVCDVWHFTSRERWELHRSFKIGD